MTSNIKQDSYLRIQLISYNRPIEGTERFYFLEMSTLQATILLEPESKVVTSEILAYTDDNIYLENQTVESFKTIDDFNKFFLDNSNYYIHNCNIRLENGICIESHDDGEVSIEFSNSSPGQMIIEKIFEKYNLDKTIIENIKKNLGCYFALDMEGKIKAEYKSFDDYITNGRD
jgi:hypothetical protein